MRKTIFHLHEACISLSKISAKTSGMQQQDCALHLQFYHFTLERASESYLDFLILAKYLNGVFETPLKDYFCLAERGKNYTSYFTRRKNNSLGRSKAIPKGIWVHKALRY